MVKFNTKYWQDEYDAKPSKITLVDQEKKNGKELSNVWNVMKRFAHHPAAEELPEVHKVVKGFAVCVPCICASETFKKENVGGTEGLEERPFLILGVEQE